MLASAEEDEGDLRLMATSRIAEEEAAESSDSLSSVCWACWRSLGLLFVCRQFASIVRTLCCLSNPEQSCC